MIHLGNSDAPARNRSFQLIIGAVFSIRENTRRPARPWSGETTGLYRHDGGRAPSPKNICQSIQLKGVILHAPKGERKIGT